MTNPAVSWQTNPHLVMKTPLGDRHLPLVGGSCWTIGRTEDNNLVISDPWISRNHAMLQYTDTGDFYLIDLGSRNGTFVNGRRVSVPVTLRNRDRLTFGQTDMDFYSPSTDKSIASIGTDAMDLSITATLHIRRFISVMVVDIRNFTSLTQQIDDAVLSALIGTWFREVGKIIRYHGSWVDKYIGDAVMAVWFHGTTGVNQSELMPVLHALNDLHKMTRDVAKRYPLPFPLQIGAGVNTGYAMVGNTGSGDRPDYTALGDTVNAAFRLESSTKQIGRDIALGETTYQYLSSFGIPAMLFQECEVSLKGYQGPTLTYACSFAELDEFLLSP